LVDAVVLRTDPQPPVLARGEALVEARLESVRTGSTDVELEEMLEGFEHDLRAANGSEATAAQGAIAAIVVPDRSGNAPGS
jgi:hypothetical protein